MRNISQSFKPETGEAHFYRGEAKYVFRISAYKAKDSPPTDVLSSNMDRTNIEFSNKLMQVLGRSLAAIDGRFVI